MDKMIPDKMTINLDVFSPFMEDIIVSNMNGTLFITIKGSVTKSLPMGRTRDLVDNLKLVSHPPWVWGGLLMYIMLCYGF